MGTYVPTTLAEQDQMLAEIGISSIDELYANVPAGMMTGDRLSLPEGMSELAVRAAVTSMADKNKVFRTILRGAGAYNHFIPSVVRSITSREEFMTAYTPYQAEISQGILQAIFEYQTMICMLTGMDASNASVYDGASAAAEAVTMCRDRKRVKAFISSCSNPEVIQTVQTYCFGSDTELVIVPAKNGRTDAGALESMLGDDAACFYLQQPNYFGQMEDAAAISAIVHTAGAKFIMGVNPIACAVMKTPFECGADIAVGEGQPLGLNMSFGGPYLGFMACVKSMIRRLPGRMAGQTTDADGVRGFVLTLTAREQHIRREKASSNICSNQALCAFTAGVYMTAMGEKGMRQAALLCMSKAHYLAGRLRKELGWKQKYDGEFFHEFVTECPCPEKVLQALEDHGILGGLPVDGGILWCVTEVVTKAELDRTVDIIKGGVLI